MSNNLERPEPDASDSQKIVQINESIGILEAAITEKLTKALDADGTTNLTDAEALRNLIFDFTGSLSSPENIIVPTQNKKLYVARNSTTGGQTVTVKTNAGTGIAITTTWKILYCDGTNVIQLM